MNNGYPVNVSHPRPHRLHIVLFQPEIPPNTGNIIRLCANTGAQLHLIHPLRFDWDDKRLRRAGLDYHEWARVKHYDALQTFCREATFHRLFAISTRGNVAYSDVTYYENDALLFGPETTGLPPEVLQQMPPQQVLRIPMQAQSRCLNLANAVSIVFYEAWRQLGFIGGH
jgi:tRNA (cytidine/uridine-2'-O-)-methyltransferase